jgi:2,4-dienoyl-CoA reductase-like NADH-dependent reductase (Old Yellow Enzyme family)
MKNRFNTLDEMISYCNHENARIGFSENTSAYQKTHVINNFTINNSLAVLPMEGADALPDGSPGELTRRRYLSFGNGGAGIIWFEAVAAVEEGRASMHQLYLHKGNVDAFKRLTDEVREAAIKHNGYPPMMIMQLTHSGRYSKPNGTPAPIMAVHNPVLDKKFNIAPEYEPVTDESLVALEDRFAETARLVPAAGFDGVDIKASHGYLLGELLGAHTRKGQYGGDYAGRTRFIKNATEKIKQAVDSRITLTTRLSLYDAMDPRYSFGEGKDGQPDLTEPAKLLRELYELDVRICAVTVGNPYLIPHVNRPFDNGPYTPPEPPVKSVERLLNLTAQVKEMVPEMAFIGAGYSWLKTFAVQAGAYTLENGHANFIGFGRQAFANPDFAKDILSLGGISSGKTCITCTKCVELMRSMLPSGCVVRDKVYKQLYQQHIKKND